MIFLDLNKVFDEFTRDVIWRTVRKIGVEEWLVKFAQSVYRNAQSLFRVNGCLCNDFEVQVGLHIRFTVTPPANFHYHSSRSLSLEIEVRFSRVLVFC